MEERTEEQKLVQAPVTVILGGNEYEIKPLVIRDSREWRKKITKLLAPLPGLVNITTDEPQEFEQVLNRLMSSMPDEVIDLFFDYAKDLNREEIESVATEAELANAFEQVIAVAFPLVESLPKVMSQITQ